MPTVTIHSPRNDEDILEARRADAVRYRHDHTNEVAMLWARVIFGGVAYAIFFITCCILTWFEWPSRAEHIIFDGANFSATTKLDAGWQKVCVSRLEPPPAFNETLMPYDTNTRQCGAITWPNNTARKVTHRQGWCCVEPQAYAPLARRMVNSSGVVTTELVRLEPEPAFLMTFEAIVVNFNIFRGTAIAQTMLIIAAALVLILTRRATLQLPNHLQALLYGIFGCIILAHLIIVATAWTAYAYEQHYLHIPAFRIPPINSRATAATPLTGNAHQTWTVHDLGFTIPQSGRLTAAVGYTCVPVAVAVVVAILAMRQHSHPESAPRPPPRRNRGHVTFDFTRPVSSAFDTADAGRDDAEEQELMSTDDTADLVDVAAKAA
jgi:hypothetical protein